MKKSITCTITFLICCSCMMLHTQEILAEDIKLLSAVEKGDIEAIEKHFAANIDLDTPYIAYNATLLMHAVSAIQPEIVKLLIENGANPRICDKKGINARDLVEAPSYVITEDQQNAYLDTMRKAEKTDKEINNQIQYYKENYSGEILKKRLEIKKMIENSYDSQRSHDRNKIISYGGCNLYETHQEFHSNGYDFLDKSKKREINYEFLAVQYAFTRDKLLHELLDTRMESINDSKFFSPLHTAILSITDWRVEDACGILVEIIDYEIDIATAPLGTTYVNDYFFPAARALYLLRIDLEYIIKAIEEAKTDKQIALLAWVATKRCMKKSIEAKDYEKAKDFLKDAARKSKTSKGKTKINKALAYLEKADNPSDIIAIVANIVKDK